jgi:DNA-directed RNA polymerase specialized sigma24 family protein
VWRTFVARPRSLLLAIVGVLLFAAGIAVRAEPVGISLVVLGVAIFTLGALLPTVQEAQIGPGGFTLKNTIEARDADFEPFVQHQRKRLQRLAYLLLLDDRAAADTVEDSFARAYGEWGLIGPLDRASFLVCTVVRGALSLADLGLVAPTPVTEPETAARIETIGTIPLPLRAVVVLHYLEQLDDNDIASILALDLDEVRGRLLQADDELAIAGRSPAGGG